MDDLTEKIIRLLEIAVYKIWDVTLVGNPCEYVRKLNEEMRHPQPGDLVVEATTIVGDEMVDKEGKIIPLGIQGIGYLIKTTKEPMRIDEEAMKQGRSDEIPQEEVTYIKLFDGSLCRWTNARFIKAPLRIGRLMEDDKC